VYFLDAGSRQELDEWLTGFAEALGNNPDLSLLYWHHDFNIIHSASLLSPEAQTPDEKVAISDMKGPTIVTSETLVRAVPTKAVLIVLLSSDTQEFHWWKKSMDEVFSEVQDLISINRRSGTKLCQNLFHQHQTAYFHSPRQQTQVRHMKLQQELKLYPRLLKQVKSLQF
jgi:hypothetical protein